MSCNAFQGTRVRDTESARYRQCRPERVWLSKYAFEIMTLGKFLRKHAHDQSRRRRLQTSPGYFFFSCLRSTRERLWICRGYKYTKFSVTLVKERDVKRKVWRKKSSWKFLLHNNYFSCPLFSEIQTSFGPALLSQHLESATHLAVRKVSTFPPSHWLFEQSLLPHTFHICTRRFLRQS